MRKPCCLVLLLAVFVLPAADKPDFSGEWRMNAEKSNFGPLPAPASIVRQIEHAGPRLRVVTTQAGPKGEVRSEFNYAVDGKEHVNRSPSGEVRSVLRWDGDVLEVTSNRQAGGATIRTLDRWTLSSDGRTLTTRMLLSAPQGEAEITVVFDKR